MILGGGGHTRYDFPDGQRALRLAKAHTDEELVRLGEQESRDFGRRYWKIVGSAVLSLVVLVGSHYLCVALEWSPPIWSIILILFPAFAMIASLGASEAQIGSERTFELARKIRKEIENGQ